MNILELGSDAAVIRFYKLLSSMVHPAGAFLTVKTAFLRKMCIHYSTFNHFMCFLSAYKPHVSNVRPAGAFSLEKAAPLDLLRMDLQQNQRFFSTEVVSCCF